MIKANTKAKMNKITKPITLENSNNRKNFLTKKEINPNNKSIKMNKKIPKLVINISTIPYNDIEMNSFDYEIAKAKDNRTYCQYYISLLKTKQNIF